MRDRRVTLGDVTFYELAGEGAKTKLEALAGDLQKAGMTTELLESTGQPGLFLLVCRGAENAHPDAPAGAKVWQFRRVD